MRHFTSALANQYMSQAYMRNKNRDDQEWNYSNL